MRITRKKTVVVGNKCLISLTQLLPVDVTLSQQTSSYASPILHSS